MKFFILHWNHLRPFSVDYNQCCGEQAGVASSAGLSSLNSLTGNKNIPLAVCTTLLQCTVQGGARSSASVTTNISNCSNLKIIANRDDLETMQHYQVFYPTSNDQFSLQTQLCSDNNYLKTIVSEPDMSMLEQTLSSDGQMILELQHH